MPDNELYDWVLKISKKFYEKAYKDPWFKKIFRNIDEEIISTQQADFMTAALGGPKNFCGRVPKDAHPQVWVDQAIWDYREEVLKATFEELNAPMELREKWLKIDEAFKAVIINKGGPEECVGRFKTDEIIYEPIPQHLRKKAA